ncbi:Lauroyl/myristoyl acyltransferase [Bernardetia litoralis DSM 6794]|uniref:Lauroyl/myristoyl acyltransferase n=1 Tax=Bernardetia litoralis (strain ATCC 23117 / DSM 6794 / NBRC 15988 / NCIMB 1366 / Fx l1 / Sio-4) TaxID=880071 RepID=I4AKP2_BERLS|nr:lysophospholipid acyltransferase family protein [Bernardetia litoralis]AFM04527.1 Lauroyl/myristoyl acyltransferase [Bernardetia litoralis DSM 6794]
MIPFFIKLLARLPLWFLYRVSDLLFVVVYYGKLYRKKVVLSNLAIAFPEKTQQEREKIAKAFYRNFCDFIIETIKSFHISKEEVMKRTRPIGNTLQIAETLAKNKQSIIALVTHHFSWEWVSMACSAELETVVSPVYKQLANKEIDKLIYQMRSQFGAVPLEMRISNREIIKPKDVSTAYILVADQTPAGHNAQYWTNFFGREVPFFVGVARLAPQANLPVYFVRITKPKRGHYVYNLEPVIEPPYNTDEKGQDFSILDEYAKIIEDAVRKSPENWLWTHKRWKRMKK